MRGKVLGSDEAGGIISTADGERYRFAQAQWLNPKLHAEIEFRGTDGQGACVMRCSRD